MYMKDWEEKLNSFLNMTGREVLSGAGHISAERAKKYAFEQYEIFDKHRIQEHKEDVIEELLQDTQNIKIEKK